MKLLLFLVLELFSCWGIRFKKRFIVQPNSYLELQNTFIEDVEINFSSGSLKGSFSISLPQDSSQNQNASFDFFRFPKDDVQGILCYKKAIINSDYRPCDFVNQEALTTLNRSQDITISLYEGGNQDLLELRTFIDTFIIDNTKFPFSGSFNGEKLIIETTYEIVVSSAPSNFIKTIGVAVALGFILIIFVVGLLYLMIKYKEVKKKYKEEIYNQSGNERSFVAGYSAKKRVGSRDIRNESFEESKAESSLNNSLNMKKYGYN